MCDTNNFWKKILSHIVVRNTSFYLSYCTYNNSQYWSHRTPVKWSPNLVLWYSFVNHDLACICVYELWPAGKKGKRRFILVLTRYFENIDQTSQSKQKSTCFKYIWFLGGQNGSDTWPYFLCILSSYPNHYVHHLTTQGDANIKVTLQLCWTPNILVPIFFSTG